MNYPSKITFPTRTSRIRTIKVKDARRTRRAPAEQFYYIWMENGDNLTYKGNSKLQLKEGTEVQYTLEKFEGKTTLKNFKIMSKALLPFFDDKNIEDYLFLDIETVRASVKSPKKGTPELDSWVYKRRNENETLVESKKAFVTDAALYPEHGKIVCISVGMIRGGAVYMKSFYGEDEAQLLTDFCTIFGNSRGLVISGWSVIAFDIPFIVKRLLVNGIRVPNFLDTTGEKPWTVTDRFLDLKDLWKGLSYRPTGLMNAAIALGLPSPKTKMEGSETSTYYYAGKVEEVKEYCQADVLATINIAQRWMGLPISESYEQK